MPLTSSVEDRDDAGRKPFAESDQPPTFFEDEVRKKNILGKY